MAFPTNPTIGQTHTIDNKTWVFNGKGWQVSRENEQYFMTPAERTKLQNIEAGAQVNTVNSVNGKTGIVTLTKSDIGLSEVDNTSDINKPISNLQQQALNNKVDKVAGKGLSTNDLTDELIAELESEKLAITKQGFNGELSPVVYPVDRQRTVIGYKLGSNATDFSVTINSVNYTKADVINVVVPVNTEIKINDVTIPTGYDTGNVVLILK